MNIQLIKGDKALDWLNRFHPEDLKELHREIKKCSKKNAYLFSFFPVSRAGKKILFDVVAFNAFKDIEDDLVIIRHSFSHNKKGEMEFIEQATNLYLKVKGGQPC